MDVGGYGGIMQGVYDERGSKDFDIIVLAVVDLVNDPDRDPVNESRVRVRIPALHGPMRVDQIPIGADPTYDYTDREDLPWAQVVFPLGVSMGEKSNLIREHELVYVILPSFESISDPVVIGTTGRLVEED